MNNLCALLRKTIKNIHISSKLNQNSAQTAFSLICFCVFSQTKLSCTYDVFICHAERDKVPNLFGRHIRLEQI